MPTKEYYQKDSEHYRSYNREYLRQWRKRTGNTQTPEYKRRLRARNAVNNAIKLGNLERQSCEIPSCFMVAEAHHDDAVSLIHLTCFSYDKPLDIVWLCKEHHEQHHAN